MLAVALGGCSVVPDSALVDPAKYEFYTCPLLERDLKLAQTRARELTALKAKAARDQSGVLIGALSYEPELKTVRGNMALMAETSKQKDCDPPIVAGREFAEPGQ